ncbi:hypothetical protein AURDEDRAFT_183085 [Auricularia subglabra TFB-10046 SS5]|nr:hypothetical protein AURDEDRAFT_183085 [Auricularia subglabra TFB-10046 SS5]
MRLQLPTSLLSSSVPTAPPSPVIEVIEPDDVDSRSLNSPFTPGVRPSPDFLMVPRRSSHMRDRVNAAMNGQPVGSWRHNCRESPYAPRPSPPPPMAAPAPPPPEPASPKPSAEQEAVQRTLRQLEKYCDSLNNVRAAPAPIAVPAPPKPTATATANFKKSHRRVHSVEISWPRALGRTTATARRTGTSNRRGGSITSIDEVALPGLPRTARSYARREPQHRIVLPDLAECAPPSAFALKRHVRTRSLDAALSALRAPKPTLLTSRSTRVDLHSLTGAGAKQYRYAQDDVMLPEGFAPSASLRGHYGTISRSFGDISKSASNLRKKVLRPLSRYLAV